MAGESRGSWERLQSAIRTTTRKQKRISGNLLICCAPSKEADCPLRRSGASAGQARLGKHWIMATAAHPSRDAGPRRASRKKEEEFRIYTLCVFREGLVVPEVSMIEAESDKQAIDLARATRLLTNRELWDRHRLVAVIPPAF